jgi:hypothetical protein
MACHPGGLGGLGQGLFKDRDDNFPTKSERE